MLAPRSNVIIKIVFLVGLVIIANLLTQWFIEQLKFEITPANQPMAALSLSFVIGRFIPEKILIQFFKDLHLQRASQFLADLEGLDSRQRLSLMLNQSPKRILPFLLKYRYLALVLAINMPGNVVIGGGGGIAMMAGLSRLFSPGLYFLTIAIAVSPIPLALLIFGKSFGEWPL